MVAKTFNRRWTRLELYCGDHSVPPLTGVWSNVDWRHLKGVSSFEGPDYLYSFILFHSEQNLRSLRKKKRRGRLPQVPPALPSYRKGGARYLTLDDPLPEHEGTLDFLEAIHALYDQQRPCLRRACRQRQKHAAQRIDQKEKRRRRGSRPADLNVHYEIRVTPLSEGGRK